jgi:hypothetical protein
MEGIMFAILRGANGLGCRTAIASRLLTASAHISRVGAADAPLRHDLVEI